MGYKSKTTLPAVPQISELPEDETGKSSSLALEVKKIEEMEELLSKQQNLLTQQQEAFAKMEKLNKAVSDDVNKISDTVKSLIIEVDTIKLCIERVKEEVKTIPNEVSVKPKFTEDVKKQLLSEVDQAVTDVLVERVKEEVQKGLKEFKEKIVEEEKIHEEKVKKASAGKIILTNAQFIYWTLLNYACVGMGSIGLAIVVKDKASIWMFWILIITIISNLINLGYTYIRKYLCGED